MKTMAWSGTALAVVVCMAAVANAAQSPPLPDSNHVIVLSTPEPNVVQAPGIESLAMRQTQDRLKDPEQRAALRTEQRAQVLKSHQDVGQALGIDTATEAKLIELLADLQMDQFEAFYRWGDGRIPASRKADELDPHLLAHADRETRRAQEIRNLLGQEGLERYQDFNASAQERRQVAEFDARLAPAHKLRADQKESLIPLYRELNTRELEQLGLAGNRGDRLGLTLRELPSRDQLQRYSQLQTITGNERIWRRMPPSDQLLRERAASFLTEPQLATLAQMNADKALSLQRWIENARVSAGLSPDIPEQPESSQPAPTPVAGEIRLSIKLIVNRNAPLFFTHVIDSGKPVTFANAEGLIVEATPTQYDDRMFDMQIAYYEEGATGKRLIGRGGQVGTTKSASDDASTPRYNQTSSTVLAGNKGYAIEMSAEVEVM